MRVPSRAAVTAAAIDTARPGRAVPNRRDDLLRLLHHARRPALMAPPCSAMIAPRAISAHSPVASSVILMNAW